MWYLVLIVLLPLAAGLAGWIARRGAMPLALGSAGAAAVAGIGLLARTANGRTLSLDLWQLGNFRTQLLADRGDAILALAVVWVSLSVFVFAVPYMRGKGHARWFWGTMSLFLGAMQLLVLAGDWITFLIGWELMGCASFLLIATEHEKAEARQGAIKAFLLTRTTDLGLYVGIFSLVGLTGSLAIGETSSVTIGTAGAAGFLLAAMGKSAQVPFQSWLRGAMAGPTPVSALLHSATMVAAGALLLLRVSPSMSPGALAAVAVAGGLTALLASLTALAARDLKHLLAASTSSQLGLMFLALGLGAPGAALAHWLAHAFMKSALFLSAGLFQERFHATALQPLRGAGRADRFAFGGFVLAGLALAGFPPLIGYTSKDAVLAAGLAGPAPWLAFGTAILAALGTALYIGRAAALLWGQEPARRHDKRVALMWAGMGLLLLVILVGGFVLEHGVKASGFELPKSFAAKATGWAVLALGLAGGIWLARLAFASGGARWARENYRLGGGYRGWIGRPVLGLARLAGRFDNGLGTGVQAVGTSGLVVSRTVRATLEAGLTATVGQGGRGGLALAHLDRRTLERAIDEGVDAVAGACRHLGQHARQWQSGMVHQELLITVSTAAGAAVFLIFTLYVT